jgi:hypothetical protein
MENIMATFGRFRFGGTNPSETYEGDLMMQDHEYVQIYTNRAAEGQRLVAAIYMEAGQSVRKIND